MATPHWTGPVANAPLLPAIHPVTTQSRRCTVQGIEVRSPFPPPSHTNLVKEGIDGRHQQLVAHSQELSYAHACVQTACRSSQGVRQGTLLSTVKARGVNGAGGSCVGALAARDACGARQGLGGRQREPGEALSAG